MLIVQNLIVFAKRPILGKVKSRLAKSIGNPRALEIYNKLLKHTIDVACNWKNSDSDCERNVYWFWDQSHNSNIETIPIPENFEIMIQGEGDLGSKMSMAFEEVFNTAHYFGLSLQDPFPIAIIGTDCPDISESILEDCFSKLGENDVVVGPAMDGGYYLLGMTDFFPFVFENIDWSTEKTFPQTIQKLKKKNIFYELLPTLRDIDREEDLTDFDY